MSYRDQAFGNGRVVAVAAGRRLMPKHYQITLTELQADAVEWACELAGRLSLGQMDEFETRVVAPALSLEPESNAGGVSSRLDRVRMLLDEIKRAVWPQLGLHASYGISAPEVPDRAKDALDVMATLRYVRLNEIRSIPTHNVWANPPLQAGTGPLPTVESLDALAFAANEAKRTLAG